MELRVSVVIPVYNTEKYIRTCLLTVINQTYSNIEIIIVNDASTDSSEQIIQEMISVEQLRKIHLVNLKDNKGVGNARNVGLEQATGDFVLFLDSDDWIDTHYISQMTNALARFNADIAVCGIYNEYDNLQTSSIRYFYDETYVINGEFALKLLSRAERNDIYITPMVGNKLFRRDFLYANKLSFLCDSSCEDDMFTFLAFVSKPQVVLVSETNQHYRQRETSITHNFDKKRIDDLTNAFIGLKEILVQTDKYEEYQHEFSSFLERCITTTIQSLLQTRITTAEKKQYLCYLLQNLVDAFTLKSLVEYLDLERIAFFFGLTL